MDKTMFYLAAYFVLVTSTIVELHCKGIILTRRFILILLVLSPILITGVQQLLGG